MVAMGRLWANTGSSLATLMFLYTIFKQWFPHMEPFFQRLFSRFYPYIQIKFHEYTGEHFKRNEVYSMIQAYLSKDSSARAKKLKANTTKGSKSLVLSMDDREEITDEFEGVTVWWQSKKVSNTRPSFSFYPGRTTVPEQRQRHMSLSVTGYIMYSVLFTFKSLNSLYRWR